jgi:predicted transcriptional regulator
MSQDSSPSFTFPAGVMTREVEGELVLLDLRSEQYYGLDSVGADVVTRLTRQSLGQTLDELCQRYEVDVEVLRADVERLVQELLQAGLLERSASRPS